MFYPDLTKMGVPNDIFCIMRKRRLDVTSFKDFTRSRDEGFSTLFLESVRFKIMLEMSTFFSLSIADRQRTPRDHLDIIFYRRSARNSRLKIPALGLNVT